jgi:hypothetical protein
VLKPSVPYITDELIEYLKYLYRDVMPEPTVTDRELWIKRGEVGVVRHLSSIHKQQRENALGDKGDVFQRTGGA